MSSAGPQYAAAASSAYWASFTVARLGADDGSNASVVTTAAARSGTLSDFGFSLPGGVVISKISASCRWAVNPNNGKLRLDVGGSLAETSAEGVWAPEWLYPLITAEQLNDVGFAVVVSARPIGVESTMWTLDYVSLTVEYHVPAAVTTTDASSVTQTTAESGGNVTTDGDGTVTEKGVCWNASGTPTIAGSHTSDGSGTGAFTSSLTGLYPSFRYYVRAYCTSEFGTEYGAQVTFDTLASSSRSLVARPFTTRAAAAEFVARQSDAIVDWWIENGVARAELRPTDVAAIPRSRWYVVSRDTPGASVQVTMDSEDTPDIVCVIFRAYGVTGVRDGTVQRVYSPAAPTSPIERVQLVDLTGQYMGTAEATSYADNVMLRASAGVMAASITATGGLYTVDGFWRPAPLILAGDWIDVLDLPGHAPTYITGTTFAKATGVATITTGGREQSELVIPGISSLPAALSVYGQDTAYETYSAPSVDPYSPPDPGPGPEPDQPGGASDDNPWTEPFDPYIPPYVQPPGPGKPIVDPFKKA